MIQVEGGVAGGVEIHETAVGLLEQQRNRRARRNASHCKRA